MEATDVDPTRLAAAKEAATSFVKSLPAAFRVGVIAFSTDARLVVAPTADRGQVLDAIANLNPTGGTALGDAIALSVDATADARAASTDVVDGAASPSPSPAATPAPSGRPIPRPGPATARPSPRPCSCPTGRTPPGSASRSTPRRTRSTPGCRSTRSRSARPTAWSRSRTSSASSQELQVPPDTETLKQVADMTGGKFFDAPSAEDLAAVYESLGSRVGFTTQDQEVTQWFAAGALLLVIAGAGLAAVWFNRFP